MPIKQPCLALISSIILCWPLTAGGQPADAPGSATPSLQDLVEQFTGSDQRTVRRRDDADPMWGGMQLDGGAPWDRRVENGTVLSLPTFFEDFNNDGWRRSCYAYQGVTHFNREALNFTYGGEGRLVIYQFDTPEIAQGGSLRFDMLYGDARGIQVGIARPLRPAFPLDLVERENEVMTFLPAADSPVWVILDGSVGNGAVIDNLEVIWGAGDDVTGPALRPESLGLGQLGRLEYDNQGHPTLRMIASVPRPETEHPETPEETAPQAEEEETPWDTDDGETYEDVDAEDWDKEWEDEE